MLTPKQERNGDGPVVATADTDLPGPGNAGEVAAVQAKAEADANTWVNAGREMFTSQTASTPAPLDWDSGLAVPEQPGEQ